MVWEANPSIEVPQSLASLKWVPHSGFRPILFPLCTNNQWDFTGLKASQGTQQNRAKPWPQLLGNLPMYRQKPGHTCILWCQAALESIDIAWEPEERALVP